MRQMKEEEQTDQPVKQAEILERFVTDHAGKEAGLAVASRIYMVMGFVGLAGCILAAILTANLWWFAGSLLCLFIGVTLSVLFGALSEITRLLKSLAGLPYAGTISGAGPGGTIHVCSECGALAWPDSKKCKKCKAEFVKKE
jgi:hypothetical protein